MKILLDRDACQHASAFADRCLAATIREPLGHDRYCAAQEEDDGRSEVTVVLIFDGEEHTLVLHDQAERELVASQGWPAFLRPEPVGLCA